jgi:hypothetical protein
MIETLGNLGDFVGGIGVAITLVYLAIQVRQNTVQLRKHDRLAHAEAAGAAFDAFSRFRSQIIGSPEVAGLYHRGSRDPDSLDPIERLRFAMLVQELFYILFTGFQRSQAVGLVRVRERLGVEEILGSPGTAQWWAKQKHRFEPDFIAFVEGATTPDG